MSTLQEKLDKEVAAKEQKQTTENSGVSKSEARKNTDLADEVGGAGPQASVGTKIEGLQQTATFKQGKENIVTSLVEDGKDINKQMTADAQRTKEILWSEPLVPFMCPLDPFEKAGQAKEFVSINGYNMHIMKGVYVKLPQSVVERLMEHYQINNGNIMMDKRLDRDENVQKALSK